MLFEAEHHDPKQTMLFADCALMVDPDAAQLAEIAVATVQSARQFLDTMHALRCCRFPPMAAPVIPWSTRCAKPRDWRAQQMPDTAIEGEVQLDAAIVPAVARQKIADSR